MLHSRVLSGRLCRRLQRLLVRPVRGCAQISKSGAGTRHLAAMLEPSAARRTVRGVVFDMDGTLTVPVIDFQYMRQVWINWD